MELRNPFRLRVPALLNIGHAAHEEAGGAVTVGIFDVQRTIGAKRAINAGLQCAAWVADNKMIRPLTVCGKRMYERSRDTCRANRADHACKSISFMRLLHRH